MRQKLLFWNTVFLLCVSLTYAQQKRNITGVVQDETGVELPGASVVIKGTTAGTTTDLNGQFTLEVEEKDIVVVSFIGYRNSEKSVLKTVDFTFKLVPEQAALDEVVITALGISKAEKKIGYATQNIDVKKVQEVATPNMGSLLSGQVAGLQVSNPPGMLQAPKFSLRGKDPLIVIDGIPVTTDFYDVSPEDIANINVLKGTSASVLYGSLGRNGAIMITTKNAKTEGITVEVSQNLMMSAGYTLFPKTQHEYGSGSNGKYEFWDGKDGGISDGDMIWGPKFESGVKIAQWNSPIRDKQTGSVIPWYGNVEGTQYDDKSRYERVPITWEYHDNLKDFMETGIISRTNFAVSNKTQKGSYRLGGDFSYNKDRVPNTSMYRGSLNFKSTTYLTDKLTLDSKLSYSRVHAPNVPNYDYNPSGHMYTILIWMGDDVNGRDLKNNLWTPGMEGYKQASYNYAWYNNPWFGSEYFKRIWNKDVTNAQLSLSYQATEDLVLQGRASMISTNNNTELQSPKSYFNYSTSREGGYSLEKNDRLDIDYDFLAMYSKNITDNFAINVNAGAASRYYRLTNSYAAADGLTVPGVHNLGNSKGPVTATNYLEKKAVNSVYGTVEFDLYNAFFLSFAGRNDWSSALAKSQRSYFYPSASLSVVVSNLVEMPEQIDYLKLYTSWANVSSDLTPYQLQSTYSPINPSFNGNQMVEYPNAILNPYLLPEKSKTYEVGLSSAFYKKRFNMDVTYYRVLDSNFIIDYPVSEASGFNNMKVNGNEYTTNGWEISLTGAVVKNDNFQWNSAINWSARTRKLTKIHEDAEKFGDLRLNDRVDSYYGTEWMKSPDGKVILDEKTGMPTANKQATYLGHKDPKWTLGWNNSFKYKNWGLNIGIDGIWGGVMRSEVVEKMWWGGKHPESVRYRDEEYSTGNPVFIPSGVNLVSGELVTDVQGNVISDTRVFKEHTGAVNWQSWAQNYPYRARVTEKESKLFANVFDRTYFKLRTLSLSYDFTPMIKSEKITQLSASLTGYNLLMWKKSKGLYSDPDYDTANKNDIQDPSTRWIGLGLNVKF
ncbi:SusC/RagA family TonB-linked outer membrane protein [Myroides sp. 1354]|uniref:SusC/RagA family TonB-linked outer membrane protein n=1 Tax=unclassified Myroides TaxID=2642485 RepID=UPI002578C59D|nr:MULTISPECIES: SusC/RagA family TonB-linked outer membrane protein [unclassified Myroides]MDM1045788.1 SusC/RagA family TonB-linked outer membrane protein [Myroides sp. R163-1]MDM1055757.1 SusC/RagA family TonB-linked outer membrane protein [Myroides sp. 1354]MDM1069849.1 SusC/RagA family TonB-linked outer membrane protein [Myroides sp. 1372]